MKRINVDRRLRAALLVAAAAFGVAGALASEGWFLSGATFCVLVVLADYAYHRQQGH